MENMITNAISMARQTTNFEDMTIDDLKRRRSDMQLKMVHHNEEGLAYLVRMIDILLDKVEQLEEPKEIK